MDFTAAMDDTVVLVQLFGEFGVSGELPVVVKDHKVAITSNEQKHVSRYEQFFHM